MTWHYRVIRSASGDPDEPYWYDIHEVYYGDDGTGSTVYPATVGSDTVKGLKWMIREMRACLDKPVLEEVGGKLVEVKEEGDKCYVI